MSQPWFPEKKEGISIGQSFEHTGKGRPAMRGRALMRCGPAARPSLLACRCGVSAHAGNDRFAEVIIGSLEIEPIQRHTVPQSLEPDPSGAGAQARRSASSFPEDSGCAAEWDPKSENREGAQASLTSCGGKSVRACLVASDCCHQCPCKPTHEFIAACTAGTAVSTIIETWDKKSLRHG